MRRWVLAVVWLCPAGAGARAVGEEDRPAGADEGLFAYRFERADRQFADLLKLRDGTQYVGKVMEWADQVLLLDASGAPRVFPAAQVEAIQFRRAARHLAPPREADLTVAWVERLPRDPSWQGHVKLDQGLPRPDIQPEGIAWGRREGEKVTFRIHVQNAGGAASTPAPCRVRVDGKEVRSARLGAIPPGGEEVVEATWEWQAGRHVLRVEIDPPEAADELRWNNTFEEPVDALGVAVVVAADRYRAFSRAVNVVDSNSFADWVQYQFRSLNALMAASVHPSAPRGILERVRCDRIIVAEDPAKAAAELRQAGRAEGLAEYAALLVFPPVGENEQIKYTALKVDWPAAQRLCGELGLVDLRATDTRPSQNLVPGMGERYVHRHHVLPWPVSLMHTAGPFRLSEMCAGYLNQNRGRPRGFRGEFLYQLPASLKVRVRSNSGRGLEGVQVDAFQLQTLEDGERAICGYGADPFYSAPTDADGILTLLNQDAPAHRTPNGYELRANPFGRIAVDGRNGLLLLRLRSGEQEEFHFVRLFDCLIACLRGQREEYVHTLRTRFGDPSAPPPPALPLMGIEESSERRPTMLFWSLQPGSTLAQLEEFRVYRRFGLTGDEAEPWRFAEFERKKGRRWFRQVEVPAEWPVGSEGGPPQEVFYAVTAVDKAGRESGLSSWVMRPGRQRPLSVAVDSDVVFLTLSGPGDVRMLRWDARAAPQPFAVQARAARGYEPDFAGIVPTADHRLLVADPSNHVLAVYDLQGNLQATLPARESWPGYPSDEPGEFSRPVDVAVDGRGRIYVADQGNHRVQILEAGGAPLGLLDEDFRFEFPQAVGFGNDHLCVTDRRGARIRVYACGGDQPSLACELPALIDADRASVNREGVIFVTGRVSSAEKRGLLRFTRHGKGARLEDASYTAEMGSLYDPVGMYLYLTPDGDYFYFANSAPIDLRRFKADQTPDKPVPGSGS
jgi:hypothetical protein